MCVYLLLFVFVSTCAVQEPAVTMSFTRPMLLQTQNGPAWLLKGLTTAGLVEGLLLV